MFGLGFQEMLICGVVAILLFGKNLPEMAKVWGKHYRDFRKGLSDLQSNVDFTETYNSAPSRPKPARTYEDDYEEVSAPKFVPPPSDNDSDAA